MGQLNYIGKLSIADAFPILDIARKYIRGLVALILPSINARIGGLTHLTVNVKPPKLSGSIDLAAKILLATRLRINLPKFYLSAVLAAKARIEFIMARLQAGLSWRLGYPGRVHVFVYEGTAGEMGATIESAVGVGKLGNIENGLVVFAPAIMVEVTDAAAMASLKTLVDCNPGASIGLL